MLQYPVRPKEIKGDDLVMTIALSIIHIIAAVFLITVILLQSGKSAGLSGALTGSADTFLSKNKGRSLDRRLAQITKWVATGFALITLVINLML